MSLPTASASSDEVKGLSWMATCALVYALSAMIASLVNLVNLAVLASHASVAALFATMSLTSLLGAVGWIMALPALVVLALGLYQLGRVPGSPRSETRRTWLFFGAGTALFVVTVPLVLLIAWSRTASPGLVLLQSGIGLASSLALLWAAALPAMRRGRPSWVAPARIAVLLGLVAAVLEGAAAAVPVLNPSLPLVANWPPVAWGFPASFVVLASAFVLFLAYSSLMKSAKGTPALPSSPGLTGAP